jgi:hypothetical protein
MQHHDPRHTTEKEKRADGRVQIAAINATSSNAHTYTSTMNTQLKANRASLTGHSNSVP